MQGNNFGIGLVTATNTSNIVENNTVFGNTNGIFIVAGVQGNTFRGNLVTGNPPIQGALDHSSSTSGFDILNLATPGANVFQGNVCLTSVNARCPPLGPSLTANPSSIPVTGNAFLGS